VHRLAEAVPGSRTTCAVLGSPDDPKFCSSMTLFGRADPAAPAFRATLGRCFGGEEDPRTAALLG
jgi:uncharacterized protein (DUF1810 family)